MPFPAILFASDRLKDLATVRAHLSKAGIKNPIVTFPDDGDLRSFLTTVPCTSATISPFLLLLDLNLPGSNGFEILRWIREQPDLADLPVILLAGPVEPKDVKRAAALGVSRVVARNAAPRVLADAIASVVDNA